MKIVGLSIFAALCLSACPQPTSFKGDPHFPGGPNACFRKCESAGMVMDSYIFVGEYSTGCVCRPKLAPHTSANESTGSSTAATALVSTQMWAAEEQRGQRAAAQQ